MVFIGSARRRELPITKIKNTVGEEGRAGEWTWGDQELGFACIKFEMSVTAPSGRACPLDGCVCEPGAQGRGPAWRCIFGSCWWIGGI